MAMQGQNTAVTVAKKIAGALSFLTLDSVGSLITGRGTAKTTNITGTGTVSTTARRLTQIIVLSPGTTSGAWSLNDSATTGTAAAANLIWTLPYNGTANVAGAVFSVDIPLTTGLTVSAVPGGGTPIIELVYA